ncbi:MAG: hypothetical protein GEV11_20735 [Streptosporangiales bacterium]|nr:hypothetical protein [Streptosporangiales bacterium]
MAFSAEHTTDALTRVGATFRLLMQVRVLIAGITLLLIPPDRITLETLFAVVAVAAVSWIGSRLWRQIVGRLVRHPILLSLDVLLGFAVLEVGGPIGGVFFLSTVITSAVAGLLYRWGGVLYVCLLQVLLYLMAVALAAPQTFALSEGTNLQTLVGQPAFYPLVGFVGVAVRRLFDQQAITEAGRVAAETMAAAAEERARLAREMHDSVAKTLRGIAMTASALPAFVERSPERARAEARSIASAAEIASREARELIGDLRSDRIEVPLAETVEEVAGLWARSARIEVDLDLEPETDLPVVARYEMVAVLKEALTNVERHSRAQRVDVELACADGAVTLRVRDDGRGFELGADARAWLAKGHYGLVGLYERAERANGELAITSAPGEGTEIRLTIPSEDATAAPAAAGPAEHAVPQARPAEVGRA